MGEGKRLCVITVQVISLRDRCGCLDDPHWLHMKASEN